MLRIFTAALLIFLSGNSTLLTAQQFLTNEDLDNRSRKRYEEAKSFARIQQYEEAVGVLDELLEKEPLAIEALLLRAQLQYDRHEEELAEVDFERVLNLSMTYQPRAIYQLGLVEYHLGKYDEAVTHYEAYLALVPENDRRRDRVEGYLAKAKVAANLMAHPVPFDPVSIGSTINTDGKEYLPSFSADGRFLVYTVNYTGREDFYFSYQDDDGNWSKGEPLSGVNTEENEGAQSISADGSLLFFTGCHWPDSYGSCDLYYARKEGNNWGNLRHAAPGLNSPHWDTQPSLSANGDYLYFTSNRPGGKGGSDIWRTKRQENGRWGTPENLGEPINTKGHEQSPFLHADGQTLYFASDTHPGLGDYDIFVARLDDNGEWGVPKNIGYPINTSAGEGTLVVSLNGQTAYYTTDQNTKKGEPLNLDIYQFHLYEEARPKAVTYVRGYVYDAVTKEALADADVSVRADGTQSTFAQLQTLADGSFMAVLPLGENYGLEVDKEGYLFYSDRFELKDAFSREDPYQLSIPLRVVPVDLGAPEENEPIVLRNVLFATGSAELLPISEPELDRLVNLLESYPELPVRINGHTDDVGDDENNLILSEARAKSVFDYLLSRGIAAKRLEFRGFGESRPIADNSTPEGRKLNRRTEFELISQ